MFERLDITEKRYLQLEEELQEEDIQITIINNKHYIFRKKKQKDNANAQKEINLIKTELYKNLKDIKGVPGQIASDGIITISFQNGEKVITIK